MYRKINVYINGNYEYSTNCYPTCKAAIEAARTAKHIEITAIPKNRYITVYDYDRISAHYAK